MVAVETVKAVIKASFAGQRSIEKASDAMDDAARSAAKAAVSLDEFSDETSEASRSAAKAIPALSKLKSTIDEIGDQARSTSLSLALLSGTIASVSAVSGAGAIGSMASALSSVAFYGGLAAAAVSGLAAASALVMPIAGAGLAGGAVGGALLGGVIADPKAEKKLKAIKKQATQAIKPLRTFSDMSFAALRTGVSFLGDLSSMLAGIKGPIKTVTDAWGRAFASNKGAIIDELRKTIVAFLPALKKLGLYIIKNAAPALRFLREQGKAALPELTSLAKWSVGAIASFIRFGNSVLDAGRKAYEFAQGIAASAKTLRPFAAMVSGQIVSSIREFGQAIGETVKNLTPFIKLLAGAGTSQLTGMFTSLMNTARPLAQTLKTGLVSGFKALFNAAKSLRPTFEAFKQSLSKNFAVLKPFLLAVAGLVGPLLKLAAAIGKVLLPILVGMFEGLMMVVRPILSLLTPALRALAPIITKVANVISQWATRNQGLLLTLGKVIGFVAGLLMPLGSLFKALGLVGKIIARVIPAFGRIGGALLRAGGIVRRFGAGVMQLATRIAAGATRVVAQFARMGSQTAMRVLRLHRRVVTTFTRMRAIVARVVNVLRSTVVRVFTRLAAVAIAKANQMRNRVIGAYNKLKSQAIGKFNQTKNRVLGIVEELKRKVISKINSLVSGVTKRLSKLQDKITGPFKKAYDAVVGNSYVPDLVNESIGYFNDLRRKMPREAQRAAGGVISAMKALPDAAANVGVRTGGAHAAIGSVAGSLRALSGAGVRVAGTGSFAARVGDPFAGFSSPTRARRASTPTDRGRASSPFDRAQSGGTMIVNEFDLSGAVISGRDAETMIERAADRVFERKETEYRRRGGALQ